MSDVSVDIIKNRNGEAPDLPSGANLSGVSTAATLQVTNLNPTHINASGVTTATTFSGSLKSTGTPTLGLGVTINSSGINISGVATAGIVSATTLYGDGSNMTGVAMSIAPVSYNPDVNDSTVPKASGIGITFTERIIAGTGNVTLRVAGAAGTVVENFGVGSSVTINNNSISIDPTSDLTAGDTYYISYPSGTFKNTAGDVSYVGTAYTFGVKPDSYNLFSWGGGGSQLGQNQPTSLRISSPVQIPGNNWGPMAASTNLGAMMASVKTDGTLWTWGNNEQGALGQNSEVDYSSPVQVPGTTWARAAVTSKNVLASKTDGTLWALGEGDEGALGQNDVVDRSSPVQIPGSTWGTGVQQLIAGDGQTDTGQWITAIKTNGTLWSWGGPNDRGELGVNNRTQYSSPIQVGSDTTWLSATAGDCSAAAIKTDGTLWSWGYNGHGRLGLNNTTTYSSPVQVPGTSWKQVSMAQYNGGAVRTDGTLWLWGNNNEGQLGQGNNTVYSSPKQVPGTSWDYIQAGQKSYLAVKTDGTIWTWGNNEYGTLGHNNSGNPTNLNSPVQVGSDTDWYRDKGGITYSGSNFFATKQV